MTAASRRHMDKVAQLPCVLCAVLGMPESRPVHVHHLTQGKGLGTRASDFLTLPLCIQCHQGKHGIHGDRQLLRLAKVSELDLLAETIRLLQ